MSIESDVQNLRRIMFFIHEGDVVYHYEKTTKSHVEWFKELYDDKTIDKEPDDATFYYTRGSIIDNDIIFYSSNYNGGYQVSNAALRFGNLIAEAMGFEDFSVWVGAKRDMETCELTPSCLFYKTTIHNTYYY